MIAVPGHTDAIGRGAPVPAPPGNARNPIGPRKEYKPMSRSFAVALGLVSTWAVAAAHGQDVKGPPAPPATITLFERHGHVTPQRSGFQHTGGGNIDVAQPAPDTLVVTMTGVAVAGAH